MTQDFFAGRGSLLSVGAQGADVEALQRTLKELGLYQNGATDGIYGPKTEEAVRAFQRTYGLSVDGIVGPQTRAMILTVTGEPLPRTVLDEPNPGLLPDSPINTAGGQGLPSFTALFWGGIAVGSLALYSVFSE